MDPRKKHSTDSRKSSSKPPEILPPRDKCGVVGLRQSSGSTIALTTYYALYALQHRGQEGAGIVTHDGFQQHAKKGLGLVGDVFSDEDLQNMAGNAAIGHIRYPTYGSINQESCHPFTVNTKRGSLALGHNGNLINADEVKSDLEENGHMFTTDSDTEVMVHELARNLLSYDIIQAIKKTMDKIEGAYSVTLLYNDTVIGIRDPHGIRPLCIGEIDGGHIVASESVAIDVLEGNLIRDVKPGEVVVVEGGAVESYQLFNRSPSHCFFEHVYFSRPDSQVEGAIVYDTRRKLGQLLYKNHGVDTDIVSPVPDSGRSFATGYAEAGNLRFAESLMKNRYVGRTFIMPTQQQRQTGVHLKLNPIRSNIRGKTVTLIDDSIVRGTTSKQLITMLREKGAEEIHMRIGSPPIVSPCFLGIDMASEEELIAHGRSIEDVRNKLGADSLDYLTIEEVSDALGTSLKHLCTGCVSGKYPVDLPGYETDHSA